MRRSAVHSWHDDRGKLGKGHAANTNKPKGLETDLALEGSGPWATLISIFCLKDILGSFFLRTIRRSFGLDRWYRRVPRGLVVGHMRHLNSKGLLDMAVSIRTVG